jgi:hypothetical protein
MPARGMMTVRIAALLFLSHSLEVCIAEEPEAMRHSVERAMALVTDGKPLAGLATLESDADKDHSLQELATLRSFVGDWHGAHLAMDNSLPKRPKDAAPFSEPVIRSSALDAIVEQARHHHIVIVNEAHHVPQHRAFILQMLRKLRTQRFEYYAVETLDEDVQQLTRRGYAVRATGFYTNEPVFGDVIREALAMGFKLVAYEATSNTSPADPVDAINSRETGQCRNLMERLFAKDADARVIVHVGFDHVMERPRKLENGREISWLAARLARATGCNPLTIDQTMHSERGAARLATPQWQQAVKNGWLDQPIVLKRKDGAFDVTGHFAGSVDIQILHPPTKLIDGRPDWLVNGTGRTAVSIPEDIRAESARVLVQAFLQRESEDAIPVDQVVLMPGEPRPKLLLKPGEYRIVVQDVRGREILRRPLVLAKNEQSKSR